MEMIKFQIDNVLKNLYNEMYSKTESDLQWILVKICVQKEIPNAEIIDCENVYHVWFHMSVSPLFQKWIIFKKV